MPSYFWMSKIDINILLEFVLPAEKVGGWVGAEKYSNFETFRFVKTIGNPGRPLTGLWTLGYICLHASDGLMTQRSPRHFPRDSKTHKKDTLQAHYKHLESFCLHKYTFKPSHQVKYRQEKRNRNSGLNTVRRW